MHPPSAKRKDDPNRGHAKKTPQSRKVSGTTAEGTIDQRTLPSRIDDPKVRGIVLGALGAGASYKIAAQLADVGERTIHDRKAIDPAFREECENAPERSDAYVTLSLFRKATGDGPQSVAACIFWLKNRRPDVWRERTELQVAIGDIPARLEEAAQRARARRALLPGVITAEVIEEATDFVADPDLGGNGNGHNGNGHE